jgi:hypothetical protein
VGLSAETIRKQKSRSGGSDYRRPVGSSVTGGDNLGTGWQMLNLTSATNLTSGTYYWLVDWTDDDTYRVSATSETNAGQYVSATYGAWPSPLGAGSQVDFRHCMYAPKDDGVTSLLPEDKPVSATAYRSLAAYAKGGSLHVDITGAGPHTIKVFRVNGSTVTTRTGAGARKYVIGTSAISGTVLIVNVLTSAGVSSRRVVVR